MVVTHRPDGTLPRNLHVLRRQVNCVYVVDNDSPDINAVDRAAALAGCTLIRNRSNQGTAFALNQGLALAHEQGASWLWVFDQDTELAPGACAAMEDAMAEIRADDRIAVLGMSMRDRQTNHDYAPQLGRPGQKWFDVKSNITSGSLISVPVALQLGGFDERLFIDGVDHAFCLKCRQHGWRVVKVPGSQAVHSLGSLKAHRILGFTLHSTNHSALRRYYMARNTLLVVRTYFWVDPAFCLRELAVLAATALTVVLFETSSRKKLRALAYGIGDFWRGRFGPAAPDIVSKLRHPVEV